MNKISAMIVLILTTTVGLTGCSGLNLLNGVLPSTNYTLTESVRYGDDDRHKMDIYQPRNANGTTLFFVFGGAWRSGEKKDFKFVAHALTSQGYKVVIPNYRLYPQVIFPGFVIDIAQAIKRYEQSDSSNSDERFVLMGHSAGAYTAALLTTDSRYLLKAGVETPISALVALSGPYDLPLDDPEVIPVFPNIEDPELVNITLATLGELPPVLLMHGVEDKRVFIRHTYAFADAIKQSGNDVTVRDIKGGHTKIIASLARPLRFLNDSYDHLIEFLNALPPNSSS